MDKDELENMRKVIRLTLIRIGIRCDMIGYQYLCKSIEYAIMDESLLYNTSKDLFPKVAKDFGNVKSSSVERCMRHSIENTCDTKSFNELNKMFKMNLFAIDEKPTLAELIQLVAQFYLLDLYKEYK